MDYIPWLPLFISTPQLSHILLVGVLSSWRPWLLSCSHHSLNTSLPSGMARCSRLILYVTALALGPATSPRRPGFFALNEVWCLEFMTWTLVCHCCSALSADRGSIPMCVPSLCYISPPICIHTDDWWECLFLHRLINRGCFHNNLILWDSFQLSGLVIKATLSQIWNGAVLTVHFKVCTAPEPGGTGGSMSPKGSPQGGRRWWSSSCSSQRKTGRVFPTDLYPPAPLHVGGKNGGNTNQSTNDRRCVKLWLKIWSLILALDY